MNELIRDLADALDPDERRSWPGVIEYDPDIGPGRLPAIYLPAVDELPTHGAEDKDGD